MPIDSKSIAATPSVVSRLSVTDLFTVGIGPSSSHTVGPMRAAAKFVEHLADEVLDHASRLKVSLFGSLSLTGRGHRTDTAVIVGLLGYRPESVDPAKIDQLVDSVVQSRSVQIGKRGIAFDPISDIVFTNETHPGHPNALTFALHGGDQVIYQRTFFSVGGGFVVSEEAGTGGDQSDSAPLDRYPFGSAAQLLSIGRSSELTIAEIVTENEVVTKTRAQLQTELEEIRKAMMDSIARGCEQTGTLPGGLNVKRRAKALSDKLAREDNVADPMRPLDWVSLYALAVNEENAAGGRVVTAPTNGAAGVIPAVLKYYETFCPNADSEGSHRFLLTAAAIGMLYKRGASISAAEMGCQGEVGVACSMAAAGLTAALGGSNEQVENAAEIGMEHNLGLTCDPIRGLVQIPCIERNTMGALKAINASRLALHGDGVHIVSLDAVIKTMRQTGEDMRSKYKETSQGGLAVNVVEC
jgi:L-serine dehydratase